jgi:hypothetical protein
MKHWKLKLKNTIYNGAKYTDTFNKNIQDLYTVNCKTLIEL